MSWMCPLVGGSSSWTTAPRVPLLFSAGCNTGVFIDSSEIQPSVGNMEGHKWNSHIYDGNVLQTLFFVFPSHSAEVLHLNNVPQKLSWRVLTFSNSNTNSQEALYNFPSVLCLYARLGHSTWTFRTRAVGKLSLLVLANLFQKVSSILQSCLFSSVILHMSFACWISSSSVFIAKSAGLLTLLVNTIGLLGSYLWYNHFNSISVIMLQWCFSLCGYISFSKSFGTKGEYL